MNRLIKLTGTLLLATSLSGCVIAIGNDAFDGEEDEWQQRQSRNVNYIQHLDLGRHIASIEADLGNADFVESFQRDGDDFRVLYYRTQRVHDDGKTTMDETTPLVFIDRELVGWGHSAIDKATR
ncbi:MAG: DUF3192 domain-containing protein [Gammaproteobacteria bacterium]|nr:MAG: DUF3192 domain-containing protein [Gammaproteobacteria bacterium]